MYNRWPLGFASVFKLMSSWKFTASLPSNPEYQLDEDELEVWNRLQTNSRRALFRFGRFGNAKKRTMPRYDLVNRLQSDLKWTQEQVYRTWEKMLIKCQSDRRKSEGYEDYKSYSPFIGRRSRKVY
jgi:hypothetical protein